VWVAAVPASLVTSPSRFAPAAFDVSATSARYQQRSTSHIFQLDFAAEKTEKA